MIRLLVAPESIDVTPGSAVSLTVTVVNDGAAQAQVRVRLVGIDRAWLAGLDDDVVDLDAGERAELPLMITLPFGFPAGAQLIGVEATAAGDKRPAIASLQLVVADIDGVSVRLSPASFRGGRHGRFKLNVINRGSAPIRLQLTGRSAGQTQDDADAKKKGELSFRFEPEEVSLRPGERVRAKGRVTARRPIVGGRRTRPLTIVAQSNSSPLYIDGRFTQRPVMSKKVFKVIGLLCVLSMWAGALLAGVNLSKSSSSDTAADAAAEGSTADEGAGGDGGSSTTGGDDATAGDDGVTGPGDPLAGQGGAAPGETEGAVISGQVTGLVDRAGVLVSLAAVTIPSDGAIDEGTEVVPPTKSVTKSKTASSGKVFAGAAAVATAPGGRTTETNDQGFWSFAGLEKASYQLTFSKAGFAVRTYVVTVSQENENIPLEVELVAGDGSLSGTIADATGTPLGGAKVSVTDGTVVYETTTPTSGNVGTWTIGGLATPGTYLVTASLRGYGDATTSVSLAGSASESGVDLALVPGVGSVAGIVTGGDDAAPLGGITVTAASEEVTRSVTTLTDDPIGAYTLPQLPIGPVYTLTVSGVGWVSETKLIDLDDFESGNAKLIDFTLRTTTGRIAGVVTDEEGKELASVGVTISQDDPLVKTLTSEAGAFDLLGLSPGTYTATFELFGYATQSVIVELAEGGFEQVDVELVKTTDASKAGTAIIRGSVRDGLTGAPIPTATVTGGGKTATSDANGAFVLSGLAAGTVTLTFTHSNHETTTRIERPGVKADLTIDQLMLPFAGLQGQATDLTATALPGVTVTVTAQPGTPSVSVSVATTDANGEYLIAQALPTGSYVATFAKAGYGSQTREFEATAGSNAVADVQLVELGTITGSLQEPGGGVGGFLTLSNVTVTVERVPTTGAPTVVFGPVVVNGSYSVSSLLPGNYRVTATHPVNGTFTRDLLDLRLREIRDGGMVLARGAAAVNGQVYFAAGSVRSGIVGADIQAQIVVGFDILPTFPFVTPRLQNITVKSKAMGALLADGVTTAPVDGYWEMIPQPVSGSVSNYTVTKTGYLQKSNAVSSPTASGSGDFLMAAEPQTITGTATLSTGAAGVGTVVTASLLSPSLIAPLEVQPVANASGVATYTFPDLPPGTYTITLSAVGYHTVVDTVSLPSGASSGTTSAGNSDLLEESSIAVTVRSNNPTTGSLVSGAAVTITALSGSPYTETATTASSGIASFTQLTNRTYRISVSRTGFESATSSNVAVAPMIADEVLAIGEDATVTVPLQKHPDLRIDVTGRLANISGPDTVASISNATVTATPVGGGAVITLGGTSTAGRYLAESIQPGQYRVNVAAPVHEAFVSTDTDPLYLLVAGTDVVRSVELAKLSSLVVTLNKTVGATTTPFDEPTDGTPTVTATPTAGGSAITLTETATGTYTAVTVASGTAYALSASAANYASATGTISAVVAGTTRTATLVLAQFSTLTVHVQDAAGNPIAANSVTATPTGGTAIPMTSTGVACAPSAISCRYEVASIAPGTYAVRADKTGYVSGTATQAVTAGTSPIVTVTVRPFPDATVHVSDGTTDINSAVVLASPVGGGAPIEFTSTGTLGNYTASAVPTGAYTLGVTAAGYASYTGAAGNFQSTTLGAIAGTVDVVLTIAASIRVNVTAFGGTTPVDDATVVLRVVNSTNSISRQRFTGDDGPGSALFNELVPLLGGTGNPGYRITISKVGYETFEFDNQGLGTGTSLVLPVSLKRLAVVSVHLSSSPSATALLGATVTASLGSSGFTAVPLYDGVYFFPYLEPGTWTITASAPDHANGATTATVVAGVDQSVNLALAASPTLTVTVTGGLTGGGQSAAGGSGALVTATPTGGLPIVLGETTTVGTYRTTALPPGTYEVQATKAGYTPGAVPASVTSVAGGTLSTVTRTLLIDPSLTVTVTSSIDGLLEGATVAATPAGGGNVVGLADLATPNGAYAVDSIAAGTYTVVVTSPNHVTSTTPNVVVAPGVNKTLAVAISKLSTLSVAVTSVLGGASPGLDGATVTATETTTGASYEIPQLSSTSVAGDYALIGVPAGTYTITASAPDHATGSAATSATILTGANASKTIDLDRYPTLTVNVTGGLVGSLTAASGAGAVVTATPSGGGAAVPLVPTSTAGTYTAVLSPATYTVSASRAGYTLSATDSRSAVAGTALTAPTALTLLLDPSLTVNVTSNVAGLIDTSTVTATPSGGGEAIGLPVVTGGTAGDYVVGSIAPGTYTVTVETPSHATNSVSVAIVAGVNKMQGITVLKAATLTVTVRSQLDGASAANLPATTTLATVTATETTTGAVVSLKNVSNGATYTVTEIPAGTYTVTASATGYSSATSANITIANGTNDTDDTLTLLAYPTVTAVVTANPLAPGSDIALSGATVTATPTAGGAPITVTESATPGTYTYLRLPPGAYSVSATKSGYTTAAQSVTATAGAALTLSSFDLDELPTLTVNVLSDVSIGSPVSHITSPLTSANVTATLTAGGGPVYTLTHIGNGTYSSPIPVGGGYTITAIATGHTTTTGAQTVSLGASPAVVSISLPALPGTITGHVRNVLGAAISGASVTGTFGSYTIGPVTTDATGAFTFPASTVPAVTWTLTYTFSNYGTLAQSVTVPRGASIVADAYLAPLGAALIGQVFGKASGLTPFGPGNELVGLSTVTVSLSGASSLGPQTVTADNTGNYYYMFANITPGTYTVTFTETSGAYTQLVLTGIVVGTAELVTRSPALTKIARDVTFSATNGASNVEGVVFRIANAGLLASPGYLTSAATSASGTVTVSNVPPGTYDVTVTTTPAGFVETVAGAGTLSVPNASAAATYSEAFSPIGTVSGAVTKNDDAAALATGNDGDANGATVTITKGTYSQSATVASGSYSLPNVPVGTGYTVTFALGGYVTETASAAVTANTTTTVDASLDKLSTFTVTVTDQNGTALVASDIRLVQVDGLTPITNNLGVAVPVGTGSSYTFTDLLPGTAVYVRVNEADYVQLTESTVRTLDAGVNSGADGRTVAMSAEAIVDISTSGLINTQTATVTFTWTAIAGITGSIAVVFDATNTSAAVSVPPNTTVTILHPNSSPGNKTGTIVALTTTDDLDDGSFDVEPDSTSTLVIAYA